MKLCIPIERNEGMESAVYGHFGSAPAFVVVDTANGELHEIANRDLHHRHGTCSPLKALGGEKVDGILVSGIGAGALHGLHRAGLKVYRSMGRTIADNVAMMAHVELPELSAKQVCGGHNHGHGCSGH